MAIIMQIKFRRCTLLVTHACNIGCRYCYERHKDDLTMSCQTALYIVEHELTAAEHGRSPILHITFMGGEPFLNFDVIRSVVEWLEKKPTHVRFEASATTNGTLITAEIKTWLMNHADRFKVQLSYDGSDSVQTRNRSSLPVDLDFFTRTFPLQGIHITIDKGSLGGLSARIQSLMSRGVRCSVNLAYGSSWTDEDALVYLKELRTLAEYCLHEGLDLERVPVIGRSLESVDGIKHECGTCRGCSDFNCYDVDGSRYPCHLFSPLVVGESRKVTMSQFEADETMAKFGGLVDDRCRECPLCNFCSTCYGFNYLVTGSTGKKDHSICKMMFAQVCATSEFQVRYYTKVGVDKENARSVGAAVRAFRHLHQM